MIMNGISGKEKELVFIEHLHVKSMSDILHVTLFQGSVVGVDNGR